MVPAERIRGGEEIGGVNGSEAAGKVMGQREDWRYGALYSRKVHLKAAARVVKASGEAGGSDGSEGSLLEQDEDGQSGGEESRDDERLGGAGETRQRATASQVVDAEAGQWGRGIQIWRLVWAASGSVDLGRAADGRRDGQRQINILANWSSRGDEDEKKSGWGMGGRRVGRRHSQTRKRRFGQKGKKLAG
jgi:hypothetical protein